MRWDVAHERPRRPRRPNRQELLAVIGQIQDLVGAAMTASMQDRPGSEAARTRPEDLRQALTAIFDLCVKARSKDPP